MRTLRPISLLLAVLLVPSLPLWARSFRVDQIPNGAVNSCENCHLNPAGGGARNNFGRQVERQFMPGGNVSWGPLLASRDADNDGAGNGAELQDPLGQWTAGQPAPGVPARVTRPGSASSAPFLNLTVQFSGMTPHLGQTLWLRVVDTATGREAGRTATAPIAEAFQVTLGVIQAGRSYRVDFFADHNGNGRYDTPPADAAWRLEANNVSGDTVLVFAHNTSYTDVDWTYLLTVNFTLMTPHAGQLLELRLVDQMTLSEVGRQRVEFIPGAAFAVTMPGLRIGRSYRADFYADFNNNGLYDAPSTDHAWRLRFSCTTGDTTLNFAHSTGFTDIAWPYLLTLNLAGMGAYAGDLFEARVVDPWDGTEIGRVRLPEVPQAEFSIGIPGLATGTDYNLDFFADVNGDGAYDPPPADHAWRIAFNNATGDVVQNFAPTAAYTDIGWPPPVPLYFPRLSYQPGAFTDGYGFVNPSAADEVVRFRAYDDAGLAIDTSDPFTWPSLQQAAFQAEAIFGLAQPTDGWVAAEASTGALIGFFLTQMFSPAGLVGLDGAPLFYEPVMDAVLPRVKTIGAFTTDLFVANPGTLPVRIDLTGYDGAASLDGGRHEIPPMGYLRIDIETVFGTAFDGCLRLTADGGVVGNAIINDGGAAIGSINLLPVTEAATELFAPHITLFPDVYYTEINLVNPTAAGVTATLAPYNSDGSAMAAPFQVAVPANQVVTLRDTELGLPAGVIGEGWLAVTATDGLLGCLTFGNPLDNHYMSTLPLAAVSMFEIFFAQVANGDVGEVSFFTGLSVVNPNDAASEVTISVFGSDGTLFGTVTRTLEPREKYVRLLGQIEGIGDLPSQGSGYIYVSATEPVFAFVLFGDDALNFLSAVPAS